MHTTQGDEEMTSKSIYVIGAIIVIVLAFIGLINITTVAIGDQVQATLLVTLYDQPGGKEVCKMKPNEIGMVIDIDERTFGSSDHRSYYKVGSLSSTCTGWSEVSVLHFYKLFWK